MTMLIKLNDAGNPAGLPPLVDSNFRDLFPERTFPQILLPSDVEGTGYGLYDISPMPALGKYEKAAEGIPAKDVRGIWMQTWVVAEMTDSEKQEVDIRKANNVRGHRFQLLASSDWTQISDSPISAEKKAEWVTYRQALRDVPEQSGFPWEVTWPTRP